MRLGNFFTYIHDVLIANCYENWKWRSYVRVGTGKFKLVDPLQFADGLSEKDKSAYFSALIADPFLFHYKGVNWLFYETVGPDWVETGYKGKIGCLKEVNGKWINQGIVLEQPWHMSYPQVFEEDGHLYMIPEQSASGKGDVSLYEATDFPRGWKKVQTLIDRPFADSTLLRKDGHYYMACYTIPPHETAELWHAPSLLGPWERHPEWQNIHQDAKYRRCGGAFLFEHSTLNTQHSTLYRVAQDCDGGYGLRLYKIPVLEVSPEHYREGEPIPFLDEKQFVKEFKHTYNEICVDGMKLSVFDCHWRTRLPLKRMLAQIVARIRVKLGRVDVEKMSKKLLYIIDERGLKGGAHLATELMIGALQKRGYTVDVMQAIRRNSFWGIVYRAYARINSILHLHLPPRPLFLRDPFGFKFRQMLRYDTVCVMSESSELSPIVARLPPAVRKVQLIHTNYPMWSKLAHRNTDADGKLFAKFDAIGCVGTIGAKQFEEMFPTCKGKVFPFHNIIKHATPVGTAAFGCLASLGCVPSRPHSQQSEISLTNGLRSGGTPDPTKVVRLISLARINDTMAKDGPRMIRVAKRLKDAGVKFVWDNYGGNGDGFMSCQQEIERLGLQDVFRIHPFDPDATAKIADADIFVLLSHYEGLPNVIYEALLHGVPVFATKVGGIPEQIRDNIDGWLIDDAEHLIGEKLCAILCDKTSIAIVKDTLKNYQYDNRQALTEHIRILIGNPAQK